jgi:hypothetical protein
MLAIPPSCRVSRFVSILAVVSATAVLLSASAPALAHPPGAFAVQCGFSHARRDDPIVYRNQPGASHHHAFYGNRSTNARSTRRSMMRSGTTCTDPKDLAAIWFPTGTMVRHGKRVYVKAYRERTYYFPSLRVGIDGPLHTIPKNLKMIAGNPHADSWRQNPVVDWWCGEGSPLRPWPYNCRPFVGPKEDGVRAVIDFPFCWDGKRVDSRNHRSHVIFPAPRDRTPHDHPADCPRSHPKAIPATSVRAHFRMQDPCSGRTPCGPDSRGKKVTLRLASGPYYTMHADFWNTWVQRRLDSLVDRCLRHRTDCGILGVPG